MTAASPETPGLVREEPSELKLGSVVMVIGAVAFIAYAVWFFIRNFTGQFLEVGIGPEQVDKGRDQILAFSPQLYDYISHLHIAISGFIAATGSCAPTGSSRRRRRRARRRPAPGVRSSCAARLRPPVHA